MKAHRSLHRVDVLKYGPDQIAMMVASEFLRASERTQYASIANNCFERALELMGILETIPLNEDVAQAERVVGSAILNGHGSVIRFGVKDSDGIGA